MEMQLNPENLGKVYVNISSKEGMIHAQLAASNEAPGIRKALVIAGSDRRGAAYGLFTLSKGHGGEVSLFGKDLRTVQTQEFFQQIGVLFEFPYLYANLSAVDNLNYFASFYPKEQLRDVKELLEELEFKKDFLNKPV